MLFKKKQKTPLEEDMNNEKWNMIAHALLFVIAGIVIMMLSEGFLHHALEHHPRAMFIVKVVEHIGLGFFVIGGLGILVERKHWTELFQRHLRELMTTNKFLKDLSTERKKIIKLSILQTVFNNSEIGNDGGFYEYYEKNIDPVLNEPYRSNVKLSIKVTPDGDPQFFIIEEKFMWTCNANNGSIQKTINWVPDKDEIEDFLSSEILLINKDGHGHKKIDCPHQMTDCLPKAIQGYQPSGFELPIPSEYFFDNLMVRMNVKYRVKTNKMFAWRLATLTKGIEISISFPKEGYYFFEQQFFSNQPPFQISESEDCKVATLISEDWFMPDEGVAFQIMKT